MPCKHCWHEIPGWPLGYPPVERCPDCGDARPAAAGRKTDAGKARFDLIPTSALDGLARCLAFGAAKYSDDNWSQVPKAPRRYYSALLRHVEAWRAGERVDVESGLHHLDHAMACLVFLRALDEGQIGTEPGAPTFLDGAHASVE